MKVSWGSSDSGIDRQGSVEGGGNGENLSVELGWRFVGKLLCSWRKTKLLFSSKSQILKEK